MAISSAGLGSNLDINSLVSQLMALERRPLTQLDQRKSQFNSQLSAYGRISSAVSALQSAAAALKEASGFKLFKATPDDGAVLTATADATASAGMHSITVTQLARAQKLASAAFADTDTTTLGTGTLTLSNGSSSFSVTIDGSNNTLAGVVNAINSAADNFGVSASILNDGSGYRLVLGPNETGASKAITVAVSGDGDGDDTDDHGLSRLSYAPGATHLTQTQAAQDAVITVDGLAGITKPSNTISDVIQGVTLKLKQVGTTALDVAVDTAGITAKMQNFVDAYNRLVSEVETLRRKGGVLEADNTVLSVQNQFLVVFNTGVNITGSAFSYLAQLGVSVQSNGRLAINGATFENAVAGRLDDVVKFFTDSAQGVMQRVYDRARVLLQPDGVLDARTDGIQANIANIDARMAQMEARLVSVERRLRAQFSGLDSLLGTLRSTSDYLARQFSSRS